MQTDVAPSTPSNAPPAPLSDDRPVILFDGVCNLCDATVRFVLARDRGRVFRFAANQSAPGRALLARHGVALDDGESANTVFLVEDGRIYAASTAVLRLLRRLPFPWKLGYAAMIFPRFLRDAVYRFIARHRYRWFGRTDTCRVPAPAEQERFLV